MMSLHAPLEHPEVWATAITVYWAGQAAFTAYRHRGGAQCDTDRGMVGGDAACKDTLLALCCPEGRVGIRHQCQCWVWAKLLGIVVAVGAAANSLAIVAAIGW